MTRHLRLPGWRTLVCGALVLAACNDSSAPLVPARIVAVAGQLQTDTVAEIVGVPPRVRVETADGRVIPNAAVTFAVTSGGGTVTTAARTDNDGYATASDWRLGTLSGLNVLRAHAASSNTVEFIATGIAGAPTALGILTPPSASAYPTEELRQQPVLQLADAFGNAVQKSGVVVTASASSGASVSNGVATTNTSGVATFSALRIEGPFGMHALTFQAPGLASLTIPVSIRQSLCDGNNVLALDLPLGTMVRAVTNTTQAPDCLEFDGVLNAGQQFLVMYENIPRTGPYDGGLYPGSSVPNVLTLSVRSFPAGSALARMSARAPSTAHVEQHAVAEHGWDFGDGIILEGRPADPPKAALPGGRMLLRSSAPPSVGDTIQVYLEGIPRLGTTSGLQSAVVRFISDDLVFADDARLPTLLRQSGLPNTPLTIPQMDSIAKEYARFARVQGNALFEGRFNSVTDDTQPNRITVVHTLMYADNLWGYTYSSGNYFAFDYWVGTNGTTGGANQALQRVADNLFMHEIAHTRSHGLLERSGRVLKRGNMWLWEGFARFTERLSIAARLLDTQTPSRTSNVKLPLNPVFNGSYFFDDVPTYLEAGTPLFQGYAASAYLFDYLADQVALAGGDHLAALRDVLINGGVEADLNAAVSRWIPGITFDMLLTRARVALYTDDSGVAGLPAWTQFHQYQLRPSRPATSALNMARDPRNLWPKVVPGSMYADDRDVPSGGAFGYLIDGTAGAADAAIRLSATSGPHGVISITRIR